MLFFVTKLPNPALPLNQLAFFSSRLFFSLSPIHLDRHRHTCTVGLHTYRAALPIYEGKAPPFSMQNMRGPMCVRVCVCAGETFWVSRGEVLFSCCFWMQSGGDNGDGSTHSKQSFFYSSHAHPSFALFSCPLFHHRILSSVITLTFSISPSHPHSRPFTAHSHSFSQVSARSRRLCSALLLAQETRAPGDRSRQAVVQQ